MGVSAKADRGDVDVRLVEKTTRCAVGDRGVSTPGEVFPWPKGAVITALDAVILAIPAAALSADRTIGQVIFAPDDSEISHPPDSDVVFLKLQPGMSVSLAVSIQACVWAEDKLPRRLKISLADAAR